MINFGKDHSVGVFLQRRAETPTKLGSTQEIQDINHMSGFALGMQRVVGCSLVKEPESLHANIRVDLAHNEDNLGKVLRLFGEDEFEELYATLLRHAR